MPAGAKVILVFREAAPEARLKRRSEQQGEGHQAKKGVAAKAVTGEEKDDGAKSPKQETPEVDEGDKAPKQEDGLKATMKAEIRTDDPQEASPRVSKKIKVRRRRRRIIVAKNPEGRWYQVWCGHNWPGRWSDLELGAILSDTGP